MGVVAFAPVEIPERQAGSRPIFLRLQKALMKVKARYLPKSSMGKAMAYALSQLPPSSCTHASSLGEKRDIRHTARCCR